MSSRCLVIPFFGMIFSIIGRSPYRIPEPGIPKLTVSYVGSSRTYIKHDTHFEKRIFELFNENYFYKKYIPDVLVCTNGYRITAKLLDQQLHTLLSEVLKRKKVFSDFLVIHKKNFNMRHGYGLLILKHKNFPLIVKLFIETAESFLQPGWKGLEPNFFFFMSGGVGRHLAGFTRIPNRDLVLTSVAKNEFWNSRITVPRKWFWTPSEKPWLHIQGENIGLHSSRYNMIIPSIYAIITDECIEKEVSYISDNLRNALVMQFCNDVDMIIDPHENNFVLTNDEGKEGITIIDTEHFPSMVGINEYIKFNDHKDWFVFLMQKCLHDIYFRTKSIRKDRQAQEYLFKINFC